MKIKAGIVGATGYAGAELVRLLSNHPEAEVAAISSVSFEGQKLSDIYPSYTFLNDMICENSDAVVEKSDVIFAALPHGLSQELAEKCISSGKAFIDLGSGTAAPSSTRSSTLRASTDCPSSSEIKSRARSS